MSGIPNIYFDSLPFEVEWRNKKLEIYSDSYLREQIAVLEKSMKSGLNVSTHPIIEELKTQHE